MLNKTENINMKTCNACGKEAGFYWRKAATGEKLDLCEEHYELMERNVHQVEKSKRLANMVIDTISGKDSSINRTECPNGKDCKYCKEIGIA